MLISEKQSLLLDSLIDKLEIIVPLIPDGSSFQSEIKSHLSSLYYCPPEMAELRGKLIANSLFTEMGEPNNENWTELNQKVFDIWSNWPKLEDSKV